mmetsp:Transcript_27588/g.69565  ORF Transcript_27588/g.69565 Transcript_27588/m.69565 type:complete len:94 (-) Transcript_27588:302-583(-)
MRPFPSKTPANTTLGSRVKTIAKTPAKTPIYHYPFHFSGAKTPANTIRCVGLPTFPSRSAVLEWGSGSFGGSFDSGSVGGSFSGRFGSGSAGG